MPQQPKKISNTGISLVYEPEGDAASPVVDIVVVHGLQGHPFTTWACKKPPQSAVASEAPKTEKQNAVRQSLRRILLRSPSTSPPGPPHTIPSSLLVGAPLVYWPRDLLPGDCPRSRVLVFGYDSKVTNYIKAATNMNTVFSHAKDLLFALSRARQPDRPLIFVAHSLGGVVVKEMLAQSSVAADADLNNIVDSTSAVVFLGTPHRGSKELATVGEWARSFASAALRMETNNSILGALSLRTTDLERAQEAFSALWFKYDFRVKTFQEGLGLTGLNFSHLGKKVVPDHSSLIGDPRERAETIQANHMEMCRFSAADDPNYLKLAGEIRMVYASLVALNERQVHHNGRILRGFSLTSGWSPRSVTSATSARRGRAAANDRRSGLGASEVETLNSLWYPGMNKRRQAVDEPIAKTCLWLFAQETYQHWLGYQDRQVHRGLLWLKGKPGSGKSTLMKEALRRAEAVQGPDEFWTASFFFDAKGSELEHSFTGMLRSVLHQLLPRYPDQLRRLAQQLFPSDAPLSGEPAELNESQLKQAFQSLFSAKMEPRVVVFIDALDECNPESMRRQAYFWREMTRRAYEAGNQLSVCISSRHFPSISVTDCLEIIVDHHNNQDIVTYVGQRLSLGLPNDAPEWKALKDRILERSDGIFLWVTLVVEDVLKKWDDGESLESLLRGLDGVPVELEALFLSLLRDVEPSLRPLTLELFQWAVLATRPLRLYEWQHILGFANSYPSDTGKPSLEAWRRSDRYVGNYDQLAKRIRKLSKGLLEMVSITGDRAISSSGSSSIHPGAGSLELHQGENRTIQVIHESVREFLLSGGASALLDKEIGSSFSAQGHISIMRTCLYYIDIKELDALVEARLTRFKNIRRRRRGRVCSPPSFGGSVSWRANSLRSSSSSSGRSSPGSVRAFASAYSYSVSTSDSMQDDDRDRSEAAVFDDLKEASDTDWARDYLALQMSMDRVARELSMDPSLPNASTGGRQSGQTQVLEDYAALLHYAAVEMFTHAKLAQQAGADPTPVVNCLQGGEYKMWERLLALGEGHPSGLVYSAACQGLVSWIEKLAGPTSAPPINVNGNLHNQREFIQAVRKAVKKRNSQAFSVLLHHFGYPSSYMDVEDHPLLPYIIEKGDVAILRTFVQSFRERFGPLSVSGAGRVMPAEILDGLSGDWRSLAPLHIAVSRGLIDISSELLAYGANVDVVDTFGQTPLHKACRSSSRFPADVRVKMVKLLLDWGADVKRQDQGGSTPLHEICSSISGRWRGGSSLFAKLLGRSSEPDMPESRDPGSSHGEGVASAIVDLLVEHGADVNARTTSLPFDTPLGLVRSRTFSQQWPRGDSWPERLAVIGRLLEAGAHPHAACHSAERITNFAVPRSSWGIVSELLRHAASLTPHRSVLPNNQARRHRAKWTASSLVTDAGPNGDAENGHSHQEGERTATVLIHPVMREDDTQERCLRLTKRLVERAVKAYTDERAGASGVSYGVAHTHLLTEACDFMRTLSEGSSGSHPVSVCPTPRTDPACAHGAITVKKKQNSSESIAQSLIGLLRRCEPG